MLNPFHYAKCCGSSPSLYLHEQIQRERERERQTETETDRQTDRDKERKMFSKFYQGVCDPRYCL